MFTFCSLHSLWMSLSDYLRDLSQSESHTYIHKKQESLGTPLAILDAETGPADVLSGAGLADALPGDSTNIMYVKMTGQGFSHSLYSNSSYKYTLVVLACEI